MTALKAAMDNATDATKANDKATDDNIPMGENAFAIQSAAILAGRAENAELNDEFYSEHVLDWTLDNRRTARIDFFANEYRKAKQDGRGKKGTASTRYKAIENDLKPLITRIAPNLFGFEYDTKTGIRGTAHMNRYGYSVDKDSGDVELVEYRASEYTGDTSKVDPADPGLKLEYRTAVIAGYQDAKGKFTKKATDLRGDSVVHTSVERAKLDGHEALIKAYFDAKTAYSKSNEDAEKETIMNNAHDAAMVEVKKHIKAQGDATPSEGENVNADATF